MFLSFLLIAVLTMNDLPVQQKVILPAKFRPDSSEIKQEGDMFRKTMTVPADSGSSAAAYELPDQVREYALPASVYKLMESDNTEAGESSPFLPGISIVGKGLAMLLGIAIVVFAAVILNYKPKPKE